MEKSKEINFSFYILIILFMQVIFSDLVIYFFSVKYMLAQVIGLVINILFNIFILRKKIIKVKSDFNKWDLIFFFILFAMFISLMIIPDQMWDTFSYHIYLQKFVFADKINYDFFPGRTLTSFVFPIVDRLFYLFRARLGYRLGTLPSYLIFIVMFYQIKKILKKFLDKDLKDFQLSILSMLPMSIIIMFQQLGTYYIDNFSVVLLLEFAYILLFEHKDLFKNKTKLYFLAFLSGLIVCTKLTNAVYIFLPIIYMLILNIKDIKNIKWYDYIGLIFIALLPMLSYFIDAIVQTGSPVFPYYNTIFKSEYFANENWLDTRYGPKNLFQLLIWPVYIIFFPGKAYENYCGTDINFATGYIISIAYMIHFVYKKFIKKEKLNISINYIYSIYIIYLCLTWGKFSIGYTRYAGIIPVLSSIFVIKLLIKTLEDKKLLSVILLSFILVFSAYFGFSNWLKWHVFVNYDSNNVGDVAENIKINISCLLKDQDYLKYDIDGIWGVIYDDSMVPSMLNVDDKIVQLAYGFQIGETEVSEKIYWENVLENDIYVPIYKPKYTDKLNELDKFNFKVIEIVDTIPNALFLYKAAPIYIVKVEYIENEETPNFVIFDNLLKQAE